MAYVYKWTELSTGKWYIGVRFAKGCHPDDGYLCSSRTVKPKIVAAPDDWKREVLCIGTPEDMSLLEVKLLITTDAKHDIQSYNKHNGDGKFSCAGKESPLKGIPSHRSGMKNSPEHRAKISAALKGRVAHNKGKPSPFKGLAAPRAWKPQPIEANIARSKSLAGRPRSAEHNAKNAAAHMGKERPKVVCRLSDRREMCLAHFNRYSG